MNSAFLFIVFVLFSSMLSSQEVENKKQYFLGGSANITIQDNYLPSSSLIYLNTPGTFSNSVSSFKYTHYSFSPYIGKEFGSNWLVGFQFIYGESKRRVNFDIIVPQPGLKPYALIENFRQIGIFARYTLIPENRLNIFIQPFANYNNSGERIVADASIQEQLVIKSIQAGSNFGIVYYLNERGRLMVRTGLFSLVIGSWKDNFSDRNDTFTSLSMSVNLSNLQFGYEWMF